MQAPNHARHANGGRNYCYLLRDGFVLKERLPPNQASPPLLSLSLDELLSAASTGLATRLTSDVIAMKRITFILTLPPSHPLHQLAQEICQLSCRINQFQFIQPSNSTLYQLTMVAAFVFPIVRGLYSYSADEIRRLPPGELDRTLGAAVSGALNMKKESSQTYIEAQQFYAKLQVLFARYVEHLSETAHSLKKDPSLYDAWQQTELKDPIYRFSITDMEQRLDSLYRRIDLFIRDAASHQAIPRHAELLSHLNQELQGLTEAWYRFPQLRHEVRRLRRGEAVNKLAVLSEKVNQIHQAILDYHAIYQRVVIRPFTEEQDQVDGKHATLTAYIRGIKLFKVGPNASP